MPAYPECGGPRGHRKVSKDGATCVIPGRQGGHCNTGSTNLGRPPAPAVVARHITSPPDVGKALRDLLMSMQNWPGKARGGPNRYGPYRHQTQSCGTSGKGQVDGAKRAEIGMQD